MGALQPSDVPLGLTQPALKPALCRLENSLVGDPFFNSLKNSLKDAGWDLFSLLRNLGQRSSVICPRSHSL